MPLCKVCMLSRSKRIIVKSNSLQDVIENALLKFNVTTLNAKLVLEEDGTEIDDDDIFLEIVNESGIRTTFMLLVDGQNWTAVSTGGPTDNIRFEDIPIILTPPTTNVVLEPTPVAQQSTPLSSAPLVKYTVPWNSFPRTLLKACEENRSVDPADRREMVRIIAEGILHVTPNRSTRSLCNNVAKTICGQYKSSFSSGDPINGHEPLRTQIYSRVGLVTASHKKRGLLGASVLEDSPDPKRKRVNIKDAYGCVAYLPDDYPEGETEESQELLRLELVLEKSKPVDQWSESVVCENMKNTFVAQRYAIVLKKDGMQKIAMDWPFLVTRDGLLSHAEQLMGFNTRDRFYDSTSEKGLKLHNFLKSAKGKVKERVEEEIFKVQQAANQQGSQQPFATAIVPLLSLYFGEEAAHVLVSGSTNQEEALATVKSGVPTLVIKGTSLYDPEAKCLLVIENVVVARVRSALDGFLLLFLSFFIFNMLYPKTSSSTMEFIQRSLMGINPPTGTKRGGKQKKSVVAPKVATLIKALSDIDRVAVEQNWDIHSDSE